jgi:ribosome biogenesis GTPase
MAKRRLSHRQQQRIKTAQLAVDLNDVNNFQGMVISHHGGEVEVEPANRENSNVACKLRTNLGSIVCGDQVIYQQQNDDPAIISILPRQNLVQRQDGFGQIKTVAANVTQLIICLAVEPEPNLFLLDQYLLSAEHQQLQALIVLNKADLIDTDITDPFDLNKIYRPLGYQIIQTSIKNGLNIDLLQQLCIGHTNVISGVSGVGKSSLTKAIMPHQNIAIGEISTVSKEGRHTTRTSRLYHLPLGGQLIDTPGVRGFNPVPDPQQPVANGFREIAETAQNCKFSNCKHINEPGCMVLDALKDGFIRQSRYDHYIKLINN